MGPFEVIILMICSLSVSFGAPSARPSINYLKPFLVTNVSDGHSVTIHELVQDGVKDGKLFAKRYFFTPVPKLQLSSAKREYNKASRRHEVKFMVDVWDDAFLDELSSLSGINRDLLSVYPADSVKLAATGPGWDSSKYSLPRKHSSSSERIEFVIACRKEEHCKDLLQQIQRGESSITGPNESKKDHIGFEMQFRDHGSAAKNVPKNVSVVHHVLPTKTSQRIERKRLPEVLLSDSDLNQFAEEVADNLLRIDHEDPGLYVDFSDPERGIEVIKAGLFSRRVNSSAVTDWSTVLSDESSQQNRTHHHAIVPISKAGRWRGKNPGLKNVAAWIGAAAVSIAWHAGRASSNKNVASKPSMLLYAVNASKLRSLESVGDVTVDIYPPDGVARFPVTVAKSGAATASPVKSSSRSQNTAVYRSKTFKASIASLIVLIGICWSVWCQFRR